MGAGRRTDSCRVAAVALLLGLATLIGLQTWAAGPAQAHAELIGTTPPNGAHLDAAPAQVTLRFSEAVTPVRGGMRVLGPDGGTLRSGQPHADGGTVTFSLPGGLGDGIYTVAWRVSSADSHPIEGAFIFSVGAAGRSPAMMGIPAPPGQPGLGVAFGVVRWLGYAGAAALAGGVAFLVLCWPAGWADRRARRLLHVGWAGSVVAAVAAFLVQGPYAAGVSAAHLADRELLSETLHTTYGVTVLVRIGLLVVAGPALLRPASRRARAALAVAVAGLPATWPAAGHAHVGRQAAAGFVADALHLAAMATWLGGLATLLVCVLPWARHRGPVESAATASRFSRVAFGSVIVLMVTGTYQAWRIIPGWDVLATTAYGRLLDLKVAGLVVILGFAAVSRSVVRRRYGKPATLAMPARAASLLGARVAGDLPTASVGVPTDELPAGRVPEVDTRRLRRSVTVEFGLALVVLGLTSALVATTPATPPAATGMGEMAGGSVMATGAYSAVLDGPAGSGERVSVTVSPGHIGSNQVTIAVQDGMGMARAVPEVTARLSLPQAGLGPLPVDLTSRGAGAFAGTVTLPQSGTWRLDVTVRTSDIDEHTLSTQLPVH
ncbi:copper resistance CopC/CopD family protein [Micromonospora sp. SL1-18]|uniref:copper resistance CopC/CopD family protein n=1 Tax=Micromonospora sp. SL1-18 TaxID=3399128 RepID=UPI003A4DDBE3